MLLTSVEYAQYRKDRGMTGKSRQAVNFALRKGWISKDSNGFIDTSVADADWIINYERPGGRPKRNLEGILRYKAVEPPAKMTRQRYVSEDDDNAVSSGLRVGKTLDSSRDAWAEAKARGELANARLKEMEVAKRTGELVSKEGVELAMARIAKTFQRIFLDILPAKISAEAVNYVDAREFELFLREKIRAELTLIIKELSND